MAWIGAVFVITEKERSSLITAEGFFFGLSFSNVTNYASKTAPPVPQRGSEHIKAQSHQITQATLMFSECLLSKMTWSDHQGEKVMMQSHNSSSSSSSVVLFSCWIWWGSTSPHAALSLSAAGVPPLAAEFTVSPRRRQVSDKQSPASPTYLFPLSLLLSSTSVFEPRFDALLRSLWGRNSDATQQLLHTNGGRLHMFSALSESAAKRTSWCFDWNWLKWSLKYQLFADV